MRADVEAGGIASAEEPKGNGFCRACWKCFFESSSSSAAGMLRMTNMINAVLLMIAGIISLLDISNILTLSLSFYFLAGYLVCFGCLLCLFECRIGYFESRAREAFGFLYSYAGRATFLLFLSTFCFGLISKQETMGIIVGAITAVNALFNFVIIYRHGKMFEDPSQEYMGAESQAAGFVQNNPQLARSAVNAGMQAAANNPDLARQGMQAGMQYARDNPQQAAQIYRSTAY